MNQAADTLLESPCGITTILEDESSCLHIDEEIIVITGSISVAP